MNILKYLPWFHSANKELYIKLRTQVTSKVPYCCVRDKTFTSINIVKHVESSFENPYTVWGCIFKATGGTLRNESDDVVIWRHLTQTVTSSKRIGIKIMATSTTKCFTTVWQRQNEHFRLTRMAYSCGDFRQGLVKVNFCFLKPVIPWKGLNLNALQWAQQAKENNSKLNGVVFELTLIYSLQIECNFNHYLA